MSGDDELNEEPASSEDLVMHSLHKEPRRRFTCKEKGKMKMSEYGTKASTLDRRESDTIKSDNGPQEARLESTKRAI